MFMETSDRDPSDLYDDCRPEDFDPGDTRDEVEYPHWMEQDPITGERP